MRLLFAIGFLFFGLGLDIVRSEFYSKSSGVINLDASNFDDLVGVNEDEVQIIEFYAPWCGHCKQLKPEYIKLAKSVKNFAKVFAVDANEDKNKAIAGKYGIQGFPTLKMHIGTGPPIDYQGGRDASSMKQFILSKLPNRAKKVTAKNLDKFLSSNADMPRALILSKKPSTSPAVKRFSVLLADHIVIGAVSKKDSEAIGKRFSAGSVSKKGSILLMFTPDSGSNSGSDADADADAEAETADASPTIFQGNTKSFREVQQWLYSFAPNLEIGGDEGLPLLVDQSCYVQRCEKKGLCVILIKGEDEADYKKTQTILKEIEETGDQSSLFAFSQIDIQQSAAHLAWVQSLFGNMDTFYSNIVIFAPQKKRYAHYVGSVAYDAIKGFINGILSGKTRTAPISVEEVPVLSTETEKCKPKKPKRKPRAQQQSSQQQPQQSAGGGGGSGGRQADPRNAQPGGGSQFIIPINAENWQQVLYGNNQPLVVEFFAPWCGHCKQFAPEFAKAANNIKGMILFATVNCDEESNKPVCGQFGIKGFPTVKIFPVGRDRKVKNGPKDYQGPRTSKDIEKAAVNTLYSVKIPVLKSVDEYQSFIDNPDTDAKILLFSSKSKPPSLLRALAGAFDTVQFSMVSKEEAGISELVAQLGVDSFPTVFGYATDSNEKQLYAGEKSFIELSQFVVKLAEPAFRKRQEQQQQQKDGEDDDLKYDL